MINNKDLKSLRTHYRKLVNELCKQIVLRDYTIFYEKKYFNSLYLDKIGNLQYKIFFLKTEIKTLESKKSMMIDLLKKHHQINVEKIEEKITKIYNKDFAIICQQNQELKNARENLKSIEAQEVNYQESCKLYDMITNHCYPGINPLESHKDKEIYLQARIAFKFGMYEKLEELSLKINVEDQFIPDDDKLQASIDDINNKIHKIILEEEYIYLNFPYSIKTFLENETWIKENQDKLNVVIKTLEKKRNKLKDIICLIEP